MVEGNNSMYYVQQLLLSLLWNTLGLVIGMIGLLAMNHSAFPFFITVLEWVGGSSMQFYRHNTVEPTTKGTLI